MQKMIVLIFALALIVRSTAYGEEEPTIFWSNVDNFLGDLIGYR